MHNNKYNYSKCKFKTVFEKVEILCNKCNNNFWQTPDNHYRGERGCPRCKSSKGESAVREILTSMGEKFVEQKTFAKCRNIQVLHFDFYLPNRNLAIEYDGQQHFIPVRFHGTSYKKAEKTHKDLVKRDQIKNKYCQENGIKLIRIPYTEFKNISLILSKELN